MRKLFELVKNFEWMASLYDWLNEKFPSFKKRVQRLVTVIVAAASSIWAWLSELEPIFIFLIGLAVLVAIMMLIACWVHIAVKFKEGEFASQPKKNSESEDDANKEVASPELVAQLERLERLETQTRENNARVDEVMYDFQSVLDRVQEIRDSVNRRKQQISQGKKALTREEVATELNNIWDDLAKLRAKYKTQYD